MFNFLRTRAVSMQNARIVSARPMRICSFCKFHHLKPPKAVRYTQLRHSTTDIGLELETPWKKKVKRHSKKYAEQAVYQITNNKRAAAHKANAAHVSFSVDESEKLHKVTGLNKKSVRKQRDNTGLAKDLVYTEEQLDNMYSAILKESSEYLEDKSAVIEDLKECGVSDNTTFIKDSTFLDTLQNEEKEDESKRQETMLTQESSEDPNYATIPFTKEKDKFESSLSDQNLMLHLLAYMDVYIQSGMPDKALKMLLMAQRRAARHAKHSKIFIAAPYNLLIEHYVRNRHLERALNIYQLMKTNSIRFDPQTYALMFEIIAMMKNHETQAANAAEVAADMKSFGVSFDEMMSVSRMSARQREAVLQCLQLVDPQYQMQYRDVDTAHNCKLLRNLTLVSNYQSPARGVVTSKNELRDMVRKQVDMEKQHKMEVKSVALFTGDPHVKQQAIERIAEWEKSWQSAVTEAFERNLTYLKQKEIRPTYDLKILYPFLQVLPKKEYIDAIMREINQLAKFSESYSTSMPQLYLSLGKYIYKKYEFQQKMKAGVIENVTHVYKKYLDWYLQKYPADRSVNGRVKWQQLAQEASRSGICSEMTVPEWPRGVLLNIGKFLYNIIVNDVKIPHVPRPDAPERLIPAFYLLFRNKNSSYLTEEIKPHPQLYRFYKDSCPETLTFETILLPTCSPPRPWVDINTGGYLFSKVDFVRDPYLTPTYLLRGTPTKQLYPALDCLNQLGTIPWRINKPMLDILIQIFQNGGSVELDVPQPPSALPSLAELMAQHQNDGGDGNDAAKDRGKMARLALQLRRRKNEMYSLWCDCLYKLSLANHFRDKVFWLPHNMDFRGRVYPVPPHLTHLTSDLGRSILMFAQGKPLGPRGLDWLKIHAINLTGMKKREPMHKRLEFANEILDLIVDSARNPLTGKKWWTKSDEPWQTLAACKEIDNALQSPDVDAYVCRLPVHQDGSCNGLQHYAALGRDQVGAESVNLYPLDTPQDVYSVVVGYVDEYRRQDAEAGNEVALALQGHVSRKVIKQTVMTTVYGVTKFGARLQIARQLSDLKDFNQNYTWSGSLYLAEKTFQSLQTMFTSAKEIQDWFTECARVISTRCNQYVQWVTPLGLPVLQPYSKRTKSSHSKRTVKKPDTLKQKNAFPPNFIHSLDSSHMMLTSLHCEQAGITFMSVHDCFWTHPCTVDIMNRICREQFVALHCEPILKDLSEFLSKRYDSHFVISERVKRRNDDLSVEVFKNLPKKGDFDIKGVLSSRYFFS